jgi:hypothetical protein
MSARCCKSIGRRSPNRSLTQLRCNFDPLQTECTAGAGRTAAGCFSTDFTRMSERHLMTSPIFGQSACVGSSSLSQLAFINRHICSGVIFSVRPDHNSDLRLGPTPTLCLRHLHRATKSATSNTALAALASREHPLRRAGHKVDGADGYALRANASGLGPARTRRRAAIQNSGRQCLNQELRRLSGPLTSMRKAAVFFWCTASTVAVARAAEGRPETRGMSYF